MTGSVMSTSLQAPPQKRSRPSAILRRDEVPSNDSAVLRYDRIASLETIMTIRDKQAASRRLLLILTAVAATGLGLATAMGWI